MPFSVGCDDRWPRALTIRTCIKFLLVRPLEVSGPPGSEPLGVKHAIVPHRLVGIAVIILETSSEQALHSEFNRLEL